MTHTPDDIAEKVLNALQGHGLEPYVFLSGSVEGAPFVLVKPEDTGQLWALRVEGPWDTTTAEGIAESAADLGFATREQQDVTEVQPARAGATVDFTRPYCYRVDRTDIPADPWDPEARMLAWGSWDQAPEPTTTALQAAMSEAGRTRTGHSYAGPVRVWLWQRRDDEHYRMLPDSDSVVIDLNAAGPTAASETGYGH